MLNADERVRLISINPMYWKSITGRVVEDDGQDIRIVYEWGGQPGNRASVIPWATIARVEILDEVA